MTKEDALNLIPNLQDRIKLNINKCDTKIAEAAKSGMRQITYSAGIGYNDTLCDYYKKQGFDVTHYVAPFDELKIQW